MNATKIAVLLRKERGEGQRARRHGYGGGEKPTCILLTIPINNLFAFAIKIKHVNKALTWPVPGPLLILFDWANLRNIIFYGTMRALPLPIK